MTENVPNNYKESGTIFNKKKLRFINVEYTHILMDKSTNEMLREIVQKDRWLYLKIIQEKKSITSTDMTREISALKGKRKPDVGNLTRQLRKLTELGLLNDTKGEYSLTPISSIIINELPKVELGTEILRKYKTFFDTHDHSAIPSQQFLEIHKLRHAKQCEDIIGYFNILGISTPKANNWMYISTDYLHYLPREFREKMKQRKLTLKLIYQFRKPFRLNFGDDEEKEIWKDLTHMDSPTVELRYLMLRDRNPIGIRIIDEKWALFSILEMVENTLDRSNSFYGEHEQFVSWVKDIFSSIWEISEPLPDEF